MDTVSTNGALGDFDWFQVVPAPTSPIVKIQPLVWTTAHNATAGLAEAKSVGVNGLLYVFGGYFTHDDAGIPGHNLGRSLQPRHR